MNARRFYVYAIYVYMYTYVSMYVYLCTCRHMYVHICIYIYYMYTYLYSSMSRYRAWIAFAQRCLGPVRGSFDPDFQIHNLCRRLQARNACSSSGGSRCLSMRHISEFQVCDTTAVFGRWDQNIRNSLGNCDHSNDNNDRSTNSKRHWDLSGPSAWRSRVVTTRP